MQGKASPAIRTIRQGRHFGARRRPLRGTANFLFLSVLTLAFALTGCGGTSSSDTSSTGQPSSADGSASVSTAISKAAIPTKTASKDEHAPIDEKVEIRSSAFPPAGQLPARYTCDGTNTPPPLEWKGIPAGTAELALYLIKVEPVDGHLTFNWAVAGINPKVHGIQGGKLPAGAVTGLNSSGAARYDLCPPKNTKEEYVFVLFALPHSQHPKQNFNAAAQRIETLHQAEYQGFLVFTYPRH